MQYLFEALTEISIERAYSFIPFLIACTDDYDIFESIPLTPLSYSWSGSCVPMYSSWVEGLEKLLPILSGLQYIKHKNIRIPIDIKAEDCNARFSASDNPFTPF